MSSRWGFVPRGYSRFKVTGCANNFLGFEIFYFRIFWGKILESIFGGGLSGIFLGIQNNMKICGKELLLCVMPTWCCDQK